MRETFDTLVVAVQFIDPVGVTWLQRVLVAAAFEESGGVDEENLLAAPGHFNSPYHQNAGGEAGAIEEVRAETNDRFEQVHLQNSPTDLPLHAHAEEGAVGKDDRHPAGAHVHRLNHVLHPCVIAALARWDAGKVAPEGVAGPNLLAPPFEREGRVGDYTVERGEPVPVEKGRLA